MNMDDIRREITPLLATVGFAENREESQLPEERSSIDWRADYAIVLCVDATGESVQAIQALSNQCDAVLVEQIEKSAREGIELDAYLCLLVDPSLLEVEKESRSDISSKNILSEDDESRWVSRKYFLDAESAIKELRGRLTVLWPLVSEEKDSGLDEPTPPSLEDLRSRLAEASGQRTADLFFESLS